MLRIRDAAAGHVFAPMDTITLDGAATAGLVSVRDGLGREYLRRPAVAGLSFAVAGALGTHLVTLQDAAGATPQTLAFRVDTKTQLYDAGGTYHKLLDQLYYTMTRWGENDSVTYMDGKFYFYFVRWLRDHVHTLKAMKYFSGNLKSAIEFYADTQREDGMIFDNIYPVTDSPEWHETIFAYGEFTRRVCDGRKRVLRVPVENDVEYLFLEGLYYTWKATGDTGWMAGLLDSALRALHYATHDPYRWSQKHQLLKRGHTIDTWDFQDAPESDRVGGHHMVIRVGQTRFGIMHGDNTGMAVGCAYLAEMLDAAGRGDEAGPVRQLGQDLQRRLDELAWNGEFYTHHVMEGGGVRDDLGVDETRQVSLSNAYDINRRLPQDKCAAIVRTYQRIAREMPAGSPGEFYQIYPPFPTGYGDKLWQYMNGGVTTIVAGELAHGAFEHGFESYGVDILRRVKAWGDAHEDYLHCCLRGSEPEEPRRTFRKIDLRKLANADLSGRGAAGVPGWTGEGGNDLSRLPTGQQTFQTIPFDVIDPAGNGRRAVVALSKKPGYLPEVTIPLTGKPASLYFLHTCSKTSQLVGWMTFRYADSRDVTQYIHLDQQVGNWFMPQDCPNTPRTGPRCLRAWWGANEEFPNVGCHVYGADNPRPDTELTGVSLTLAETGGFWMLMGLTVSDAPVFLPSSDVSYGIPDNWGAAAVVYALLEGLAGVVDTGVAFDAARLSPRWSAAGVDEASATVKYEASDGYLAYTYRHDAAARKLRVTFTGTAKAVDVELLLPECAAPKALRTDATAATFTTRRVEDSQYACFRVAGVGVHEIELDLA